MEIFSLFLKNKCLMLFLTLQENKNNFRIVDNYNLYI